MTDYELKIAFNEGVEASKDGVNLMDNPYDGVSFDLMVQWSEGWWEDFYSDIGGQ
jgi:hypothetical protein